jgi:methyltransferase
MVTMTPSGWAFTALVAIVALQRVWELSRSRRHVRALLARGGREHARAQMPWMSALHAGWLVAMPLEVVLLRREAHASLAIAAGVAFLAGQGLRLAAMSALGERWTVRVITMPGAPPVDRGVFRWVRHPNYLGVVLEIAALPLVHGAWLTALVFSAANALLLARRIRAEEAALRADNDYDAGLGDRPRFVPHLSV